MPLRRLLVLAVPLCLATVASAEDIGDDLVLLRGGDSIRCAVVEELTDRVVVRVNGTLVDLYRSRIEAVQRGAGRGRAALRPQYETTPAPPVVTVVALRPRVEVSDAWRWEALAALGLGMHLGEIESSGTITQGALSGTLALTFDAGAIDHLPALQLRLATAPKRTTPRPVVGVQLSAAHPAGDGMTVSMYGLEALAGMRWGGGGKPVVEVIGGLGYLMATCDRDLEFYGGGALLDSAEVSTDLSGFGVRAEAAMRWERGDWRYGLAAGLTWSQLSGSDTWTTNNGVFTGDEDLDASFIGIYSTAQLAVAF